MKSCFTLAICVVMVFSILFTSQIASAQSLNVSIADLEFEYNSADGASLSVFDIPVLGGSSFWVVKSGWTGQIYGAPLQANLISEATVEDIIGGKRIILNHYLSPRETSPVIGTETYTLYVTNRFTVSLDFKYTGTESAIYEWKLAEVKPQAIIGLPYRDIQATSTNNGIIPLVATSSDFNASMVARNFQSVEIDSRIGTIAIKPSSSTPLSFSDYRKNYWASEDNPYFWLGMTGTSITPGVNYSHTVQFDFPTKFGGSTITQPEPVHISMSRTSSAETPHQDPDSILPTPKSLQFTGNDFLLGSSLDLYLGNNPTDEDRKAVQLFVDDMRDLYGVSVNVLETAPGSLTSPTKSVLVGRPDQFSYPATYCGYSGLSIPDNPEGYALVADSSLCCVAANTSQGLYYGLASLLQLVKITPNEMAFKGAEIVDYPALHTRAVHCLSGKNAGDQIAKAVRTLLARHKMNTLIWECEYLKWDSHPEIHHRIYGMDKSDALQVIDAAEDNFVEIIPLVQSLGHSEWIFANGQNLDIAEDPENPRAYCPTDPDTYTFIFSVFQEALDFFHPRRFHIGHDEVTLSGRFPYRSLSTGKSVTELFAEDVEKLYAWFDERDVQIMLWGDMLLDSSESSDGAAFAPSVVEAKTRRDRLPKDVLIADWHYTPVEPENYISLDVYREEGFNALGGAWYNHNNIRNLAQACVTKDASGFIQTTWAGFNFAIDNNYGAWYQYWAYLWAAEHAWTGVNTPLNELSFRADERFSKLWRETLPLLETKGGYLANLSSLYNRRLSDNSARTGWVGYGPEIDLSTFPTSQERFGQTHFLCNINAQGEGALMMAGKLNPAGAYPEQVELQFASKQVNAIHFLMTGAFRDEEDTSIGSITLRYEDGSEATLDLVYGQNCFAFDDLTGSLFDSEIAWDGQSALGTSVSVRNLKWENPNPEKQVEAVILTSSNSASAPIYLAMTLTSDTIDGVLNAY